MSNQRVLPANDQLLLALIGEELKSSKFFSTLRELGLDDVFFQTNLGSLILSKAGFDEESNHALDAYYELLERHSANMESNNESVRECAFRFYLELMALRK